jgi:hypothetical protein
MNQGSLLKGLLVAVSLVAGGVLAIVLLLQTGPIVGQDSGDWPDYFTANDLVKASDLIVVAQFVDEVEERVEVESPVTENSGVFREDVIRTYRVLEIIKGDVPKDADIQVWRTRGIYNTRSSEIDRSQSFDLRPAEKDKTYVLFLILADREGEPIWGNTGHPELAELEGEKLTFVATPRYLESIIEHGYTRARSDSAAPFEVTLSEIKDLAN